LEAFSLVPPRRHEKAIALPERMAAHLGLTAAAVREFTAFRLAKADSVCRR
jgi:hypothetical protein